MANPKHAELVRQGTMAIRAWRVKCPGEPLDLTEAQLTEAQLAGARLQRAQLLCAQLQRAQLRGAQLQGADLTGASLRMANLIHGVLDGAILTDAYVWETRRAGWSTQGVICEAVFWGQDRRERTTYITTPKRLVLELQRQL